MMTAQEPADAADVLVAEPLVRTEIKIGYARVSTGGQKLKRQLDTVQLDTDHGSEFLDAAAQLERYVTVLDRLEKLALSADASRDLIHRTAAAQT